ncbi:formate dehydrogenase accessory protein FdhE [uncultured Photobacterium sp.]|uniref:formate dehydrogenase accessory protein FdhE n=1 Tax=uncultured Photobacterium sp. TaxID=173973 RepID=UPI002637D176|nr:formate dehydrogenase accessory protein FdhE [uncultured Photobacterium sp.]
MSVRILDKDTIIQQSSDGFKPLIIGQPHTLFESRAARLRQLAKASFMEDYLFLIGQIVQVQANLTLEYQSKIKTQTHTSEHAPLSAPHFAPDAIWTEILGDLITQLTPLVSDDIKATLDDLTQLNTNTLTGYGKALRQGNFDQIPADQAIFVWAALNTYFSLVVANTRFDWQPEGGEALQHCPLCHSAPVASMVNGSGHRYLHCSLCETQWNSLRAQCTHCGDSRQIKLASLDDNNAPIRAETCDECQSYLKIMFTEKDLQIDPVADDLSSLILDIKLNETALLRSGFNPFLLPVLQ